MGENGCEVAAPLFTFDGSNIKVIIMIHNYVKRSNGAQALQYDGKNAAQLIDSFGCEVADGELKIGGCTIRLGDYVVKPENGTVTVMSQASFEQEYQEVFPQKYYPFNGKE